MPFKLKAWLKAKLGLRGSSIPYGEFKDEPGSTSEEVKMEPMISFDCAYCDYRSPTQKGLRCRCRDTIKCTYSKISRGWTTSLVTSVAAWTPSCVLTAQYFSGCLDYKSGHISRAWTPSRPRAAFQWLFGLQIWSHQSFPGHHQVYLQRCISGAVWTTSLITSVAIWTPSSVLTSQHFSSFLGKRFVTSVAPGHHKCIYALHLSGFWTLFHTALSGLR
ncbi:hypothetical protein TNIN_72871 [Trichonephila inaurata madagascariensis]|uniref:Uncharacterized protein n=1 Tax=Trichonephila inaurata madagascariensis TaxID=2747483 RepID=A0A8X7BVI5_9ARAC|nr:hypothetical protein TNIN_72871 [Trichonephila inaurata madagascariensis]